MAPARIRQRADPAGVVERPRGPRSLPHIDRHDDEPVVPRRTCVRRRQIVVDAVERARYPNTENGSHFHQSAVEHLSVGVVMRVQMVSPLLGSAVVGGQVDQHAL